MTACPHGVPMPACGPLHTASCNPHASASAFAAHHLCVCPRHRCVLDEEKLDPMENVLLLWQ